MRLLRPGPLLLLVGLAACTAEPSCIDGFARPCASSQDCQAGDACRELPGRGSVCVAPDGSGTRIVGGHVSTTPVAEGRTEEGVVLKNARFRSLPLAIGRTEEGITVVQGDLR